MTPAIHGHRGARGRRPENTLAAIEYALRHAADGVEVDLCVTQDDHIVLHHDLRLNADTTRDAQGAWITQPIAVRDLTLDALRQYDVGRLKPDSKSALKFAEQSAVDGAQIPVLDECVKLLQRYADESGNDSTVLNLELKSDPRHPALTPEPGHYISLLLDKLESLQLSKNVFVQSFDWRLAQLVKQRRPDLKVGFTTRRPFGSGDLKKVKNKGGDVFSCNHRGLSKSLVEKAHHLDLEVCAWTVNEEQDIARMAEWGVDVITSDYPERCRELLYGSR